MMISNNHHSVSRRAALAGFSAAGAGLDLAAAGAHVAAQATTGDSAGHPMVGLWQLDPGPNPPRGAGSTSSWSTPTGPATSGAGWRSAPRSGSGDRPGSAPPT